ncbi:MAG: hypothetical protein AB7E49_07500 [Campylobacterales bacterium]
MMRDLIRESLREAGLWGQFEEASRFDATLTFGAVELSLSKTGTHVTLSGESPEGPITVRYCLHRNWLPLSFCLGVDTVACDQEDLWERSDLGYVLGNDAQWEKHLRVLGFLSAKRTY